MITKNQIKLIRSLSQKKNRKKHKLFVAEGSKVVDELLVSNLELTVFIQLKINMKNMIVFLRLVMKNYQ